MENSRFAPRQIAPIAWLLLGLLLFVPGLGAYHLFDWDEINFAESAREMLLSGNYTRVQIDFQPFWEKPPLFIWLQTASMALFGVNEMAARLPNALCGAATLALLSHLGTRLKGQQMGILWPICYLGSMLPFLYFKSGIIDPVFNLFIFLGVWQLYLEASRNKESKSLKHVLLSGTFIGMAVLTKGPVGLLLPGLAFCLVWAFNRFRLPVSIPRMLLWVGVVLLVCTAWFGPETIKNGPWFIQQFVRYQIRLFTTPDAGHGQPWFYHPLVLLIGCFPASIYCIPKLNPFKSTMHEGKPTFERWMQCLFWVTLILFSISTTKIVHYSSLCYFPITFLAASRLHSLIESSKPLPLWQAILFLAIGLLLAAAFAALPAIGMNAKSLLPAIKDKFAAANLQANVAWQPTDFLLPAAFALAVVWAFVQFRKLQTQPAFVSMGLALAVFLFFAGFVFVPRIEAYSQRAAIEFCRQSQRVDPQPVVHPLGYKSYAHLFYARRPMGLDTNYSNEAFLLRGPVRRPVFFLAKITSAAQWDTVSTLLRTGEKNGFVFYRRK